MIFDGIRVDNRGLFDSIRLWHQQTRFRHPVTRTFKFIAAALPFSFQLFAIVKFLVKFLYRYTITVSAIVTDSNLIYAASVRICSLYYEIPK